MSTLSSLALSLLTATALSLPVAAQNVRMLAHVDKLPGAVSPVNHYAGIWGYVDPSTGKEYAIVPIRTGTVVYDCSDPKNPIERGFIQGPQPGPGGYFWREVQTYGPYAYLSSEHGPMQVLDLTNPDQPKLAGSFGSSAHTVSIDQATGILWANGTARGAVLYDLTKNPVNPPQVTIYNGDYVHDSLPIRGRCYLAQIFGGTFRILDTSNLPSLPILSTTSTPGAFTHNVWVDDDDRIAVTSDESAGGCLTIYDITNKAAPKQLATWCSPNGATVHNVLMSGKIIHLACYSDGYWAIDLSDPKKPVTIGGYDTNTLGGNSYHGNWGCYPFQPSGVVYLSDMQTGFWIVEPTCGVPKRYGHAALGKGGVEPRLEYGGGFAKVGNATFRLEADHLVGAAPTALVLGTAPAQVAALGIEVLVDLGKPHVVLPVTASGVAGTAGAGAAAFSVPLPTNPSLAGATLYTQVVAADSAATGGLLASSRGFAFTICP